jgi:surfeit locus 1 family protein
MLTSWRRFGLLGPTIATALAFALLMSLGTWQMQRKAWKEGLLAKIAERTHAAPVPLADVVAERSASFPEGYDPEYRHVSVNGRILHDKEQYVWAPDANAGAGYHVYAPLQPGGGDKVVWVNRGWVPEQRRDPATRAEGQVAGEVSLTGLYRAAPREKGSFTPDGDAGRRVYYWRDLTGMQAAAFGGAGPQAEDYFIDADAAPANPGGWPKGGVTLVDLPNRHLEYAITWYGLAATLLAVFAAFVVTRVRRGNAPS